jgi:hypothetical protein
MSFPVLKKICLKFTLNLNNTSNVVNIFSQKTQAVLWCIPFFFSTLLMTLGTAHPPMTDVISELTVKFVMCFSK